MDTEKFLEHLKEYDEIVYNKGNEGCDTIKLVEFGIKIGKELRDSLEVIELDPIQEESKSFSKSLTVSMQDIDKILDDNTLFKLVGFEFNSGVEGFDYERMSTFQSRLLRLFLLDCSYPGGVLIKQSIGQSRFLNLGIRLRLMY